MISFTTATSTMIITVSDSPEGKLGEAQFAFFKIFTTLVLTHIADIIKSVPPYSVQRDICFFTLYYCIFNAF